MNIAVRDLTSRFKVNRTAHTFSLAVVKSHEYVTDEMPPTPVVEIDVYGDYDPTSGGSGEYVD